jgi:hypothetical protein
MNKLRKNLYLAAALLLAVWGAPAAKGVILYTNDFNATAESWTGPGSGTPGIWTFSYNNVDGRLQGDFAGQSDPPSVEYGFWSSSTIGDVTGAGTYDLTQLFFDFYAVNFAPSSLTVYIGSGADFVSRGVSGLGLGANLAVAVDLSSSAGWGGSTAQFSSILSSIDYVEFEVVRAGVTNAQSFQLDNFQLEGVLAGAGGGGGPSAIPEPDVVNLLAFFSLIALALRRSLRRQAAEA